MSEETTIRHEPKRSEPWKWIAITLASVMAAVLVFGVVTAYFPDDADEEDVEASAQEQSDSRRDEVRERVVVVPAEPARPTATDISVCNQYASTARTRTEQVVRDGLIGGAIGAGVGAASGAIADGGKGAGKGAGIGAIVGATAGSLYGLNKANQNNANAEAAYRTCMAQRGF
jgi:hypothetical protein